MTVTLKTQKMLWGRAAGRCSKADCRLELYEDETHTDDAALVGENCHIVAESEDGPRADKLIPLEKRNSYANLILLCRNHHKVVDAQEIEYSVEKLQNIKKEHEGWVKAQLGFDSLKQREDEQYAGLIDNWERLANVDNWTGWSSSILSHGQPRLSVEIDTDLSELRRWLLGRIWPGRYLKLEEAFHNFQYVLQDFQESFRKHAQSFADGKALITEKFYHIKIWDEDLYAKRLQEYEFHVDQVQDLMLELTRAGNLICDRVRQYIMYHYRIESGRLIIQTGPNMDFAFQEIVVQYSELEINDSTLYPGLPKFLTVRQDRDMNFGRGQNS